MKNEYHIKRISLREAVARHIYNNGGRFSTHLHTHTL